MNIFSWLFQRASNGSKNIQVLILSLIVITALYFLITGIVDIYTDVYRSTGKEDEDDDISKKM